MNTDEKELYEKTIVRLRRVGCRNQEQQIIYLADEIERYRAKIEYLERVRAAELTAPALSFYTTAYTSPDDGLAEEEKTRRAQAEIARRLFYTLQTTGCISYEQQTKTEGYLRITEHRGTISVVMPQKEAHKDGGV